MGIQILYDTLKIETGNVIRNSVNSAKWHAVLYLFIVLKKKQLQTGNCVLVFIVAAVSGVFWPCGGFILHCCIN